MSRSLAIRHVAYGMPWSSPASCCHLRTELRRAIRSLKNAGPGSLRRPSARSSGLSQTSFGSAAGLKGRANKAKTKAKRRIKERRWNGQNMKHSSRAEYTLSHEDCGGNTLCVKDVVSTAAEPVVALLLPV